ncbi:MAG TPA: glycosyltransferase family 2 protein [Candidatus Saccharimonadales bacterium]|nr:glycosyltransferase family 2 protein [Candidatus Saccharimonadales bacterium]
MTDLEIPFKEDRSRLYRFFEILPGLVTWTMLFLPFILSLINVTLAAFFILAYILIVFVRTIGVDARAIQGYRTMRQHERINWNELLEELQTGEAKGKHHPKWHYRNVQRLAKHPPMVRPDEVVHAVMVATYKEAREVLEPTIKAVAESAYDMKKVILVIAYEGRAGIETEQRVKDLVAEYKGQFRHAMAVKHPADIPGEIIGKGGNVTYAGRELQKYLEKEHIDPTRVPVTTLDADNRPHKQYLAALSYLYVAAPDPVHASFQPLPMYTNNIWDAPAPMRVVATGNSFFYIVLTQRPHMQRNFSSHAQSMRALIETDFWSVRTIVEDGHQFWRSYFRFEGDYRVYPLSVPIYQDAVLADGYVRTLKAQFIQLRRWTYGASDIAYIATKGFFTKNKIPKWDLTTKFLRAFEGHVTWAVGPLLLAFSGFIPLLFNPQNYAANELPILVSRIQTVGLIGGLLSLFVCLRTLPPRPLRYKRHRTIFMVLQWIYLPLTTIVYGALAALYSQTRLMLGLYLDKFDITEKAVITETGETKI